MDIQEAISNVSADNLPCFYKYRFTFPDDCREVQQQVNFANQILCEIRSLYLNHDDRIVLGIEHYTKGMVTAKPHVHIHFVSKSPSKNIREHLRNKFDMVGRVQACKAEVLVDESKFWRYPLKQQMGNTKVYHRVFGFDDVDRMVEVAYACWKQSAEVAIRKEEVKQERNSRDRLFSYLDKKDIKTLRECMIESVKYYAGYEDSLSITTVKGYVYVYVLKKGIMSPEEMVDKYCM